MIDNNTVFANEVQFCTLGDAEEGTSITGGLITDNIFFSKDPSRNTAAYRSELEDIEEIGTIDHNYYARPLDDFLTILTELNIGAENYGILKYELSEWQDFYDLDLDSQKSPVSISPFQIDTIGDINKVNNGYFDVNISQSNCNEDCTTSWVLDGELPGGALQAVTGTSSRLQLNADGAEEGTQYILRFTASSTKAAKVDLVLRMINQPWFPVSNLVQIKLNEETQDYEVLFEANNTITGVNVEFYTTENDFTYWLDNVELFEASATVTNPDDFIRFEYNASNAPVTIPLDTSYIDVRGNLYGNSLTLDPYESVILLIGKEILVSPVVFLEGAYETSTGLMRDDLRNSGILPLTEPYTALGFNHIGGGGEMTQQSVFNITGENAVVDWVFLELRDKADSTSVVATRSALLRRNGTIVDVDGVSPLAFPNLQEDSYYLVVKHRNHLGVMSAQPVLLSKTAVEVDLTSDLNNVFGGINGIQTLADGKLGLFSGDYNNNGQIQNTDFNFMVSALGSSGYVQGDLDLNNQVQNTELQLKLIPNLGKGQAFP